MSNQWQTARTFQDFCGCLAAFYAGELGVMPTKVQWLSSGESSALGEVASILTEVSREGHLAVYDASIGQIVGEWDLRQRANLHGFVPASSIRHVKQVLGQRRNLHFAAHRPGTSSKESSYPTAEWPGGSQHGGYVISPKEIERDFQGLRPDVIEALKGSWQIFFADPEWGRNTNLWHALRGLA